MGLVSSMGSSGHNDGIQRTHEKRLAMRRPVAPDIKRPRNTTPVDGRLISVRKLFTDGDGDGVGVRVEVLVPIGGRTERGV